MEKEKYAAILPIIVASLADKIVTEFGVSEDEAMERLYASILYSVLENEETKLWYYSVPMLYELYQREIATGKLELEEY